MDANEITALKTRLNRLESKNRLLAWALLGLLVICFLMYFFPMAIQPFVPRVIKARALVAVDAYGRPRVKLHSGVSNNGASLELIDSEGQDKASLFVSDKGGSSLSLFGENSSTMLLANEVGAAQISLDGVEKNRAMMFVHPGGEAGIMLLNDMWKSRVSLKVDPEDPASLRLWSVDQLLFQAP